METLTVQMDKILDEYKERVKRATDVSMNRVSRECVKKLRNTSPKKTGDYAKGWVSEKAVAHGNTVDYIVRNKTDYQLTHLLEHGHVVVNKKGEYGRAPAHPHIKPVEEWANNELPQEIERELQ